MLANAPRLFLGTIERFRRYRRLTVSSAVLTAPRPFEHHRDGEPESVSERLDVSIAPAALRIGGGPARAVWAAGGARHVIGRGPAGHTKVSAHRD
jgi:hypothetical protein